MDNLIIVLIYGFAGLLIGYALGWFLNSRKR